MTEERLPPHDRHAERSVLGSLLRDNATIPEAADRLSAGDFYLDAHQRIFAAILDAHGGGRAVDLVVLADALRGRGDLEDVGGYGYLAELWDAAPTSANLWHHAAIVSEKATLRKLIQSCNQILRDAHDQGRPAAELVDQFQRESLALDTGADRAEVLPLSTVIREANGRIDERARHQADTIGVPSGLVDLDALTGGFHRGELVILAARPSVGKTALALALAVNAAKRGKASLFVSLEMPRFELAARLLSSEGAVDSYAIRSGKFRGNQIQKIIDAGHSLSGLPIFVSDNPSQKIRGIRSAARRLKASGKLDWVTVDYLQLIEPDDRRANRNEQVALMSRSLKLLARELDVPVVCLSQLNRGLEQRTESRPRLSDLRDSGAIEQDADTVLLLHRPAGRNDDEPVEAIECDVAKQRNGPLGIVTLGFHKSRVKFENYLPAAA